MTMARWYNRIPSRMLITSQYIIAAMGLGFSLWGLGMNLGRISDKFDVNEVGFWIGMVCLLLGVEYKINSTFQLTN